jgi:hypothetical protein
MYSPETWKILGWRSISATKFHFWTKPTSFSRSRTSSKPDFLGHDELTESKEESRLLLEVHGLVEARLTAIKLFLQTASMTSRE